MSMVEGGTNSHCQRYCPHFKDERLNSAHDFSE
jgi:hypothetical protein